MSYSANDLKDFEAFVAGGGMSKDELAEMEIMLARQQFAQQHNLQTPRASLPPRPRTRKAPHHKYPSNYTPPKRRKK